MFKSALFQLTLLYLLIIMLISLFFSVNIYRVSVNEINNNIRRQQTNFERYGPGRAFIQDPEFLEAREDLLNEAKSSLIINLLYTNIVILALGGFASYYFAKRTLKPIEESHQAQMRFASDASHELRSPLAAMKAEIEVALRDPRLSKEESLSLLSSNLEEVDRLKLLAEGLLGLTRERQDVERSSTSISELIDRAIDLNEKKAKMKQILVSSKVGPKAAVYVNSEEITELFNILIDNAIKYSDKGKKVIISAKTGGDFTEIMVKDEGYGISETDLPHIFDRFYRADHSRSKNKAEGYGLGLAIAKKIVELNSGEIEAKSREGKGSVFVVKLPNTNTRESGLRYNIIEKFNKKG